VVDIHPVSQELQKKLILPLFPISIILELEYGT
jgi:hypothetical protein